MFGTLGMPEMAVIFILALVLFGPRKLPELGRTIGKAMTEFRRASNDLKATFDREIQTLERENQVIQNTTRETAKELADHASYDLAPASTMWNPLEEEAAAISEAVNAAGSSSALDTAQTQDIPAPVGASEVPGAELSVGMEGTVPRSAKKLGEVVDTADAAEPPTAPEPPAAS
jgi:sec-independent protein translocase protein TatA